MISKKIITVVGARPNFLKAAPLLKELSSINEVKNYVVHTGQHYDKNMSSSIFEDLDIAHPDFMLNTCSGTQSYQTANIMIEFENIYKKIKPDLVIVFGDVNSTMACSIVAKKMGCKLAHIEAGLRSFDRSMPEEINRIITDSISDLFFITEEEANSNLINEGINRQNIFFVGNLMIDSLHYGLNKIKSRAKFNHNPYGLVTLHRPANVDDKLTLEEIILALNEISLEIPLFFSVHPRTKKNLENFKINLSENIKMLDAQPYLDFLHMMRDSKVIFTDSGGIQEESTVLKIPCYTLRNNTERPITIDFGTNFLASNNKNKILKTFKKNRFLINRSYKLPQYWDGNSAKRITKKIMEVIL